MRKTGAAKRDEPATLGTTAVAAALEVSERTVRLWLESGRIKADLWTLGGHARFKASTIAELKKRQKERAA